MRSAPLSPLSAIRRHVRASHRRRALAPAASRRAGLFEVLEERRLMALTNGGFETGTTTGWTASERFAVRATPFSHDQMPVPEGRYFAELDASSFELDRYTTLSNTFVAQPGDVISGTAFFASHDFVNSQGTDDGYVVLKNAETGEVTSLFYAGTATGDPATSVGPGGKTPWTAFSHTFTTGGTYKIEAGVANKGDRSGPSHLGLDNVQFTGSDAAPNTTAPTVDLGGPYSVEEGQTVQIRADAFDADENVVTYSWDRNGDGVYEITTPSPWLAYSAQGADGPATRTIGVRVTDARGNTATDTTTLQIVNAPPRIMSMSPLPASGFEGALFVMNAFVTDPGPSDTITTRWTVTRDGELYADVTPERRTDSFRFQPDDNGTYVVTLTATDDDGGSASMSRTIVIQNRPPTINNFTGPAIGVRGQERHYSATFFDQGRADTHTTAWAVLDDETGETVATGSGTEFSFTPTEAGSYTVRFTVEDDDGGVDSESRPLVVSVAETQADPSDPNATILAVGGTTGKDHIELLPGSADGSIEVFIDDVSQGVFTGVTAVRVFGQAGDDHVRVQNRLGVPVTFFGGDGDDKLITNSFSDVLVGGEGDDVVVGRVRTGGGV